MARFSRYSIKKLESDFVEEKERLREVSDSDSFRAAIGFLEMTYPRFVQMIPALIEAGFLQITEEEEGTGRLLWKAGGGALGRLLADERGFIAEGVEDCFSLRKLENGIRFDRPIKRSTLIQGKKEYDREEGRTPKEWEQLQKIIKSVTD